MIVGKCPLAVKPESSMNGESLCNVSRLEILDNVFNSQGTCSDHIQQRITKCHESYYGLSPVGMLYPGVAPDVQSYLFRTICQPTLWYGTECMNISHRDVAQLDSIKTGYARIHRKVYGSSLIWTWTDHHENLDKGNRNMNTPNPSTPFIAQHI